MTLAMEIELYGGPGDGMIIAVPEGTEAWIIPTPAMTQAEFIALEAGAPNRSTMPVLEHRYEISRYFGRYSGKQLFTYSGSRRAA